MKRIKFTEVEQQEIKRQNISEEDAEQMRRLRFEVVNLATNETQPIDYARNVLTVSEFIGRVNRSAFHWTATINEKYSLKSSLYV